jgi:SAM-dependent methyltransferase
MTTLEATLDSGLAGTGTMTEASRSAVLDYIAHLRDCRPLRSAEEREAARTLVELVGLKGHHDPQKNWDTFKCLNYIISEVGPDEAVLDAGSGARCVVPMWLLELGYTNLHACDLRPPRREIIDPRIQFTLQDLTKTTFPDNFFRAVSCISVIEHNVPLKEFAREMERVLTPDGLLLVSTDYWSDPIDCTGIFPYGLEMGEMMIFNERGLREFVETARGVGLEPVGEVSYGTGDRAVRWDRVDREYTFAFIALRKTRSRP